MALNPKVAALKAKYVEQEQQSFLSKLIQPKKESPKGKRVMVSDASEKKDDDAQLA